MKSKSILLVVSAILAGLSIPTPVRPESSTGLSDNPKLELEQYDAGHYQLLREAGPPIPLEFDPGDSPFSLLELTYSIDSGQVEADLQNRGDAPVSAWTVATQTLDPGGSLLAEQRRTQDWAESAADVSATEPRPFSGSSPRHDEGLFYPGQIHRVRLGVIQPDQLAADSTVHIVLTVSMTLFEDNTHRGDDVLARRVLSRRAAIIEERSYWLFRLDEVLSSEPPESGTLPRVEALLGELDETPSTAPPGVAATRQRIRQNLKSALDGAGQASAMTLAPLRGLADWMRGQIEHGARFVPKDLPTPQSREPSLQPKVFGDDSGEGGDEGVNCDCGGSTDANVTRKITNHCSDLRTIKVAEQWTFQCKNEQGEGIFSPPDGTLTGTGGCVQGIPCFPDTVCGPFFTAPSTSEQGARRYWSRSVQNQRALVGLCTVRCDGTSSDLLESTCQCDPRPAPSCSYDGCPVLIDIGASGFTLTDLAEGVSFDLDGDGEANQVSWTTPQSDDAWLALDRNHNGLIDDGTELFGNYTPQPKSKEPNGFLALAVFDQEARGGNRDGRITEDDEIFSSLVLWKDRDHDGVSTPAELESLEDAGIAVIELAYFSSSRRDRYGNTFRYSTRIWLKAGGRRLATDVFLKFTS